MFDSSPTAVLFPGQGSQTKDMRALVAAVRPDLLDAATELIGEDPFPRVDESTRFAQPAILCASLASWTRLRGYVDPVAFAGHSLGEFSALAAAGAILDHDALRLVVLRGDHMATSGEASGGGTMLALLGASPDAAAELADRHGVSLANDNAPGQVVLSGSPDALDAAREDAEAQGLRALPLGVAGAFHSPQMQGAVGPFAAALREVTFQETDVPVISCATAAPFADPTAELAEALVSPVRWRETMTALDDLGSEFYVDTGPGRVLAKLAPRCLRGASAVTAEALLEDIGARV
ncbi:MAG TPA: ACP S-malonyltransferase [Solirubrobacteraceae bacterium]|nr:ACP S-malonyltransferase [Solirubrobacteraceae bacterium]